MPRHYGQKSYVSPLGFPVGSRIRSVHPLKSGPRFSTRPLVVKDTLLAFAVNDKPHLYICRSSNGLGRGDVQLNVWFESHSAGQRVPVSLKLPAAEMSIVKRLDFYIRVPAHSIMVSQDEKRKRRT